MSGIRRMGADWQLVTDSAGFLKRFGHQVAVFNADSYIHEVSEIVASLGLLTVPGGATLPLTLVTMSATGGVGALRYELLSDDQGGLAGGGGRGFGGDGFAFRGGGVCDGDGAGE